MFIFINRFFLNNYKGGNLRLIKLLNVYIINPKHKALYRKEESLNFYNHSSELEPLYLTQLYFYKYDRY